MYKISEEMDEIIGSAQEDNLNETENFNENFESVLLQSEKSEKDESGVCEKPESFFEEQDNVSSNYDNNFCPIKM